MKTELISVRVDHGEITPESKRKQPNKATLQAMKELEDGKGHKADSTTDLFNDLEVKLELTSSTKPRIAGLNHGQTVMSDDFDEPLDDAFWLGKP